MYRAFEHLTRTAIVIAPLALAASPTALGQTYTIQTLSPPSATGGSQGLGINDAGVVIGAGSTVAGVRALRWTSTTPASLGVLPGFSISFAYAISNDELIVGRSGDGCGPSDPMYWDAGQMHVAPDVPRTTVYMYSVNDHATAVGEAFDSCDRPWNDAAYRWDYDANGNSWSVSALPPLDEHPEAAANDINNSGVAVGFSGDSGGAGVLHACQWDAERAPSPLPDLGGGHSIAMAMDDAGRFAGYSRTVVGDYRGYYFDGASAIAFGTLPGYAYSTAHDLNNAGTVVGYAFNGTADDLVCPYLPPLDMRGFVWRDGQMVDAISLIPANSGWASLDMPRRINNRGQITGTGMFNGRDRAFRMTPVCMTRGDLNDDRSIDLTDLTKLLSDFGCSGFVCSGDITGDGTVDLSDLTILLANFGSTCQ